MSMLFRYENYAHLSPDSLISEEQQSLLAGLNTKRKRLTFLQGAEDIVVFDSSSFLVKTAKGIFEFIDETTPSMGLNFDIRLVSEDYFEKIVQAVRASSDAAMLGFMFELPDTYRNPNSGTMAKPADEVMVNQRLTTNDEQLTNGGIDLNAGNMDMDIEKQDGGIDFQVDPAMIRDFESGNFTGVVPVILQIIPIPSVLPLLGLNETIPTSDHAQRDIDPLKEPEKMQI